MKSGQRGQEGRWKALKNMLESWALILLRVASHPEGSEQGGAESEQGFLEESTRGGHRGKGWGSREHSTARSSLYLFFLKIYLLFIYLFILFLSVGS